MRQVKPEILIFSVYQAGRRDDSNQDNHQCIVNRLTQLNIGHKVLDGVYQNQTEKSILVSADRIDMVQNLCQQFGQECYLRSDSERNTFLVYPNGTEKRIGTLKRVSKEDALKLDGYSIDNTDGSFWAAV